jgi:hypothetical protein
LKRYIDEHVKLPITNMWKQSSQFSVDMQDGELLARPSDEPVIQSNGG